MEVEYGVTPPSSLGESKDATVPENITEAPVQFFSEDVNSFQPSNGSLEGISVDVVENTTDILNETEPSNFIKNVDAGVTDFSAEQYVEINTEEIQNDMQVEKESEIKMFIEQDIEFNNLENNVTSPKNPVDENITYADNNVNVLDDQLNNILASDTQSNENILSEQANEKNTSDLLTELEGHTEFGENVQEHTSISSLDNNNLNNSEVLNKKELLDILEGNDHDCQDDKINNDNNENMETTLSSDSEITFHPELQHINEPNESKRRRSRNEKPKGKSSKLTHSKPAENSSKSIAKKKSRLQEQSNKNNNKIIEKTNSSDEEGTEEVETKSSRSKELIRVLVDDWNDDDAEQDSKQPPAAGDTPSSANEVSTDNATPSSTDPPTTEKENDNDAAKTPSDTTAEPTSQRRVSRVIKKKIIFDPDNPDTFTSKQMSQMGKTKSPQKIEEQKDIPVPKKIKIEEQKDAPVPKKTKIETPKVKADVPQTKTKEKSPIAKPKSVTQWKKPQPKNHKRLSEVDRLLMDEGAVNMMYQLNTSGEVDTPKIKKNIRSKAAFIKKLNQTTPETNEIKFRERKPVKVEPSGTVKRESKHRGSGAAASPASSDPFDLHTADDSVIIRRHSSSSYSSSCLSPRRLSDIDMASSTPAQSVTSEDIMKNDKFNEVFMSDSSEAKPGDVLDKKDCLTLKEKLNLKLSKALNVKRKRESKTEVKQKKLKDIKSEECIKPELNNLTLKFEDRVAEIKILKNKTSNTTIYTIQTIEELSKALDYIDSRQDVSVTLLLSESGDLCGGLDLSFLQQHKVNTPPRREAAVALADAVRRLFICMESHGKFVCAGVESACVGVGLSLLTLCDVVLASDRASFALLGKEPSPGVSVLTSHRKSLCRSLVTEMLVFGRLLSASEALSRGLVSRTLWPDRFSVELHAMVKDIAAQPPQTLELKKRLLSLRNNTEPASTFLSCLDAERELLAAHWSSNDLDAN